MSQEKKVMWSPRDDFSPVNATLLTTDQFFSQYGLFQPVIVQTQDEKDYILSMGLMMGKDFRVYHQHERIGVPTYQAASFITIDLSSTV